jgi:hypothetical protein
VIGPFETERLRAEPLADAHLAELTSFHGDARLQAGG